jgi:hypothetical protein
MLTAIADVPRAGTIDSEGLSPSRDWISLAEASRVSRLHETTLMRMAPTGDIAFKRRGRRTLFSAEDVRRSAG